MRTTFTITTLALALLAVGSAAAADATTNPPPRPTDSVEPRPATSSDETTTRCYWIQQGLDASSLDASIVNIAGKGNECPVILTIAQQPTAPSVLDSDADVDFEFTATLNLNDNKFGLTQLDTMVPDPMTGQPVQIAHANLHACMQNSLCDLFRDGINRRISEQETGNFSTDGKASFRHTLTFALAGDYTVFAHVALPGKPSADESLHFVAFTTTSVGSTNVTGSNATSDDVAVSPTIPSPPSSSSSLPALAFAAVWTIALSVGLIGSYE